MKCSKCGKPIGGDLGTKGNYVKCDRVFACGEQHTIGYLEHSWNICFDCWKKIYYKIGETVV